MSKKDWDVMRSVGRAIVTITVAHGLRTKQWTEFHTVGVVLWLAGEAGSRLG